MVTLSFTVIILTAVAIFAGAYSSSVKNDLINLNEETESKVLLLNNIRNQMGYGGAIHNFKNYILRNDEKYYQNFKKNIKSINSHIQQYEKMQGLSSQEMSALAGIKDFAIKYNRNIERARNEFKKRNLDRVAIDRQVKINDDPILKDLNTLLFELFTSKKKLANNVFYKINSLVLILFVLLPLVILLISYFMYSSIRKIKKGVLEPLVATQEIIKQNYNYRITRINDDEFGVLYKNINTMARQLSEHITQKTNQEIVSTNLNHFVKSIRNETSLEDTFEVAAKSLAMSTNSIVCAAYLRKSLELHLFGKYALPNSSDFAKQTSINHGILGQVFRDMKEAIIDNLPGEHIKIQTGIGLSDPLQVAIFPIVYEGKPIGVIELGKTSCFSSNDIEFLKKALDAFGLDVTIKKEFNKTKNLLEESQAKSDELEQQKAELKNFNDELTIQKDELVQAQTTLESQSEELQKLNLTLEDKSKNLELLNAKLEETNIALEQKAEELERSSKYKSEFLAKMSHELRTPLNSIIILSNILMENKKENLNKKQVEFAKTILGSGKDLLSLINDVLNISKVEAGKDEVKKETIDLNELGNALHGMFYEQSKLKGIDFKYKIEGSLSTFYTDHGKLKQILINLIGNAMKFTEEGEIALTIGIGQNNMIHFSVRDTGVGIPEAKLNDVFIEFKQLDAGTNRKYNGCGLGLSISKKLTDLLGGELNVSNNESGGTKFTLTLKYENEPNVTTSNQHQIQKEHNKMEQAYEHANTAQDKVSDLVLPTIVVCSKRAAFIEQLKGALKQENINLKTTNDQHLLSLINQEIPNIVIYDISDTETPELINDLNANSIQPLAGILYYANPKIQSDVLETQQVVCKTDNTAMDVFGIFNEVKNLLSHSKRRGLMLDEDCQNANRIIKMAEQNQLNIQFAVNPDNLNTLLEKVYFDYIVLGSDATEGSMVSKLAGYKESRRREAPHMILLTNNVLSVKDEFRLRKHFDSIINKSEQSCQKLIDELVALNPSNKFSDELESDPEIILFNRSIDPQKVLIVDDDIRNIFSLTSMLEENNLTVEYADNGLDALKLIEQKDDFSIVLMDIMMPTLDGLETIKKIRNSEIQYNIPIIAVTAKAMPKDRADCLKSGANDFISKPVDPAKLMKLIHVWINKSKH